ncbi:hypothetical protein J6590_035163 [Homalodisca vitripennis]|nr:hypothetical protein J6590_035163 [Homalodisca vitripennis]
MLDDGYQPSLHRITHHYTSETARDCLLRNRLRNQSHRSNHLHGDEGLYSFFIVLTSNKENVSRSSKARLPLLQALGESTGCSPIARLGIW